MTRTGSIVSTVIVIIAASVIAALVVIYSGMYSVAADQSHWRATRWLLETTRTQSIKARLDDVVIPADLESQERVRRGAVGYVEMCQSCHLAPGVAPTPLHQGLSPEPPVLAEAHSHNHGPEYLFWIIKHGIKMTGMPAWGETHGEDELWDLVAFVQKLPALKQDEYRSLTTENSDNKHNNIDGHGHSHQH